MKSLLRVEKGERRQGSWEERADGTCDLHVTWGCEKTQLSRIAEKLKLAVFPSQIHHLQQAGEKTITRGCQTQGNLSGCLHSEGKCSILLNPWSNGQDNPLEAIGAWRLPRESNDLKKGADWLRHQEAERSQFLSKTTRYRQSCHGHTSSRTLSLRSHQLNLQSHGVAKFA